MARLDLIEIDGQFDTLTGWARTYGQAPERVVARVASGWDVRRALTTPPKRPKRYTIGGQTRTLAGWAKRLGVTRQAILHSIKQGIADEKFLGRRQAKRMITAWGRTQHLSAWARERKMHRATLRHRLVTMPPEAAMTAPVLDCGRQKRQNAPPAAQECAGACGRRKW